MLKLLRREVCLRWADRETICQRTGIVEEDLRQFAFGGVHILCGFELDQLAEYLGLHLVPRTVQDLLPLETQAAIGINSLHAEHFRFAADMLSFCLGIIGSRPDGTGTLPDISKPRGLSWSTVHLALGLYAKIMKQGRAVIGLCEMGLTTDASGLERCMFESVLAVSFLLRPRVAIKEDGNRITDSGTGKKAVVCSCGKAVIPEKKGDPLRELGTDMRRKLYVAHAAIDRERELNAYLAAGLTELAASLGDPDRIRCTANVAKRRIGKGWAERERSHKTYSGVSIKNLSESYGLSTYYLSIYRHQSKIVHGLDGMDYVSQDDGIKLDLGPSPRNVVGVLYFAAALLFGCAEVLNDRLGLGHDAKINARLKVLRKRGKSLE